MHYSEEKICARKKYSNPAATLEARNAMVKYFTENFPRVRKLKITDCGWYFTARAKFGKRVLFAKAYRLEKLAEYTRLEFERKVLVAQG